MNSNPNRIDPTPVRLNTQLAEERQTPRTDFGTKIRDGVETAAHVAGTVASVLPGGAILSAAVSAGSSLVGSAASSTGGGRVAAGQITGISGGTGNGSSSSSGSSYLDAKNLMADQEAMNMRYLQLQQQLQSENQRFTTLSNVMKVRHDTAKNTIANTHS